MGKKQLAGTLFIRRGVDLDYCFESSIKSMQAVCDWVYVVYCESEDDTLLRLKEVADEKTSILMCIDAIWQQQKGKEKLSFFQNIGIEQAQVDGYEYVILVQADEVLHQDSIPFIKRALALGEESYFVTRHNMWGSDKTMLNVPQSRKPVSTVCNRIAKTCYRSVDDGESIAANGASLDFINLIEIFHMGFIRDTTKHIAKIKEIQGNIFQMDYDKRADLKPAFDWKDWGFTHADLISISKPLPIYLNDWIKNLNK